MSSENLGSAGRKYFFDTLTRRICAGFLLLYGLVMLWYMFLQRTPADPELWRQTGWNLIPFKTLGGFLSGNQPFVFTIVNLVGNVVMFIPLGLLPAVWKRQRRFGVFVGTVFALLVALELLQFLTSLGVADIDDLLLNVPGACIGFQIWKIFRRSTEL